MKRSKFIAALITTAFLISLVAIFNAQTSAQVTSALQPTALSTAISPYSYTNLLQYTWGQPWAANPARDGFSAGPAPDKPNIQWESDTSDPLIGTVTGGSSAYQCEFNGYCYERTSRGGIDYLTALNAQTGKVVWQTPSTVISNTTRWSTDSFAHGAVFRVDDSHLFVFTRDTNATTAADSTGDNGIAMFNALTGAYICSSPGVYRAGSAYTAILVDTDLKLAFSDWEPFSASTVPGQNYAEDYYIRAWNLSNPDAPLPVAWSVKQVYGGNPMLCCGDGKLFMGSYGSFRVYALDEKTGALVWSTPKTGYAGYSGVYNAGVLYVASASQYVIAYNTTTGAQIWSNDYGLAARGFYVWNGIYAYGRTYWHNLGSGLNGVTICIDARTGQTLWTTPTYEYIGYYQICAADGKIYGEMSDGSTTTGRIGTIRTFDCWDAFTGAIIWSVTGMALEMPAVAYGNLYATDANTGIMYCFSTIAAPQDWSMWRGTVEHPGVTKSTTDALAFNLGPGPTWTYAAGGGFASSPVISNGYLCIGCLDGYVYCLNAYTGGFIWKFNTGQEIFSTPAIVGNNVIIGPDNGNIYCLNLQTGAQIWSVPAGTWVGFVYQYQMNYRSSPIIYNNTIIVGSAFTNKVYCINLNGNVLWNYTTGGPVVGSACVSNNTVYIESTDTNLYELNAANGHLVLNFSMAFKAPVAGATAVNATITPPGGATPVVVGDRVYDGVTSRFVRCNNGTDGSLIFAAYQPNIIGETADVSPLYVNDRSGGTIYVPAGPTVAACRADNGSNIWSAWGGWEIWASAVYSGTTLNNALVYCGSDSYGFTCWNASNGFPMSWYTTGGQVHSSAAVWNGNVYVGSGDFLVYCFSSTTTATESISATASATQVNVNSPVTIAAQLSPGVPNQQVTAVFTGPDGKQTTATSTTNIYGLANIPYTPTTAGNYTFVATYGGAAYTSVTYTTAISNQYQLQVVGSAPTPTPTATPTPASATPTPTPTATPTPTPVTVTPSPVVSTPTPAPTATPTTHGTDYTVWIYAAIAVIVIIIIVVAALMLMRRKK